MGKLDGRVVVVTGAARGQGEQEEQRLHRSCTVADSIWSAAVMTLELSS